MSGFDRIHGYLEITAGSGLRKHTMKKLKQHLPEPLRRTYRDLRAALLTLTLPAVRTFSQPEEEREASRQMSIIVPVKDSAGVVQRCFRSLERFAPYAEVIVVDDGSQLPETQRLFEDYCGRNHWTVIHHRQSQGHSRACEAGVQRSTRPYLCLLNSDTVVTPWSWLAARQAFEGDPTIGVTGPCTSHSATPQMLRKAMHCRHYWDDDQICAFASAHLSTVSPRSWVDIEQAGGFAFFIRRSLWDELGGFDLQLPDYGNESELCRRVSQRGFRIVWTQNSYIHHFGEQSYGRLFGGFLHQRSLLANQYIDRKYEAKRAGGAGLDSAGGGF